MTRFDRLKRKDLWLALREWLASGGHQEGQPRFYMYEWRSLCNSTACMGGFLEIRAGLPRIAMEQDLYDTLGLTAQEGFDLFFRFPSSPHINAKVALRVLDRFFQDGTVDWRGALEAPGVAEEETECYEPSEL